MPALKRSDITVLVDTREKTPSDLGDMHHERATLDTGDYSIKGLEKFVRVERKSLPDLVGCIGRDRDRFEREMVRIRGFHHKAVLVECTWDDVYRGEWRGKIKPNHVIGSLVRWQLDGVPFVLAGPRPHSCLMLQRILYLSARQYYNIHTAFISETKEKAV